MPITSKDLELERNFQHRILPAVDSAPWVLRITDHKDKPSPVLVIKKRMYSEEDVRKFEAQTGKGKAVLKDHGLLYGESLRRCLPVLRQVVSRVCDAAGIPFELQRFFNRERITYRGNLPLDEEAGAKLALLFKLQERLNDMDRVELIAWRVERFSREEAVYWLSRATQFGEAANRWALAGMRIMLGGQPGDVEIQHMLEKLRK